MDQNQVEAGVCLLGFSHKSFAKGLAMTSKSIFQDKEEEKTIFRSDKMTVAAHKA